MEDLDKPEYHFNYIASLDNSLVVLDQIISNKAKPMYFSKKYKIPLLLNCFLLGNLVEFGYCIITNAA